MSIKIDNYYKMEFSCTNNNNISHHSYLIENEVELMLVTFLAFFFGVNAFETFLMF